MQRCVFFKQELILCQMAHAMLKKSPGWKNKLKYTQANVGAKTEHPIRQTSVFFFFNLSMGVLFFSVIVVFVIYYATTVD